MSTSSFARLGDHALVLGASIAGLVTARVLSDYFERVTLLDKDDIGDAPVFRKGVNQDKHLHILLKGGEELLEDLFTGFGDDMVARGARRIDIGLDTDTLEMGRMLPRRDLEITALSQSRPLLEQAVRDWTLKRPNIELKTGYRVENLNLDDRGRANSVSVAAPDGSREDIAATLVVDAMGRGSPGAHWLKALGYGEIEESRIGVDFRYSTCFFHLPEDPEHRRSFLCGATPPNVKAGVWIRVEDNKMCATLAGRFGEYPPADLEGFIEFAKEFEDPTIYERVRDSKPAGPVATFNYPTSIRRHFERLESLPVGYLPIGDANCSFNPVYGQGMTSAIQQAIALGGLLAEAAAEDNVPAFLSTAFPARAAAVVDVPWNMAAMADFLYEQTEGERPADIAQQIQLATIVNDLSFDDIEIAKKLTRIRQLAEPASILQTPDIMTRVMERMAAQTAL